MNITPIIPKISISNLLRKFGADRSEFDLGFVEVRYESGNISLIELFILNAITYITCPQSILELGTFNGRTSMNMAYNSMEKAIVHTVDLPVTTKPKDAKLKMALENGYDEAGFTGRKNKLFEDHHLGKRIKQYWFDTADLKKETFDNILFDLIFIDASHSYEYVINDTKFASSVLNTGGIIIWHDYDGWEGVTRGLNFVYENSSQKDKMFHIADTSLVIFGI